MVKVDYRNINTYMPPLRLKPSTIYYQKKKGITRLTKSRNMLVLFGLIGFDVSLTEENGRKSTEDG